MQAKILIVDHQHLTRIFQGKIVEQIGHQAIYAESSTDAINSVSCDAIDLVVMNADLPDMDGYQTCQLIRQLPSHVPVILTIAVKSIESIEKAFASGAQDFLCNPIIPTELKARVNNWLSQSQHRADLEKKINLYKKFIPEVFIGSNNGLSLHFDRTFDMACRNEEELSTMFVDIRNFPSLSDHLSSKECFNFLSNYFTKLEPIVQSFKGSVYQYQGDGILSIFPLSSGHSDNSLHSAVSLVDAVKIYNRGRQRAGYQSIDVGVGLHTGPVSLGVAGTKQRMSSGVFGPTVNCASRCEALSEKYQADIIVTEFTLAQLANPGAFMFRFLGKENIAGFGKPVGIYEVYNSNSPACREEKVRNSSKIHQIIEGLQRVNAKEIEGLLEELVKTSTLDPLPLFLQKTYFSQAKNKFYLSDN